MAESPSDIPTASDVGPLGTQVHINHNRPDPDQFIPPENRDTTPAKPYGGLWTSPLRDDGTSPWLDHCHGRPFMADLDATVWALVPAPDAEVYTIETESDYTALLDAYGYEPTHAMSAMQTKPDPDFEALVADYDGVYLSGAGLASLRGAYPGLADWDTESVLWLDWVFVDLVNCGRVETLYETVYEGLSDD